MYFLREKKKFQQTKKSEAVDGDEVVASVCPQGDRQTFSLKGLSEASKVSVSPVRGLDGYCPDACQLARPRWWSLWLLAGVCIGYV